MPTWDADFCPMVKKNRATQVLKNHHIPNCISCWASLQLFTLKSQQTSSASASGSHDAAKARTAWGVG
jgi:hypothetical protein